MIAFQVLSQRWLPTSPFIIQLGSRSMMSNHTSSHLLFFYVTCRSGNIYVADRLSHRIRLVSTKSGNRKSVDYITFSDLTCSLLVCSGPGAVRLLLSALTDAEALIRFPYGLLSIIAQLAGEDECKRKAPFSHFTLSASHVSYKLICVLWCPHCTHKSHDAFVGERFQ